MELSILIKNIVEIYENRRPKHRQWNRFLQRKTIPIAADGITIAQTYITDIKTFKHNDFYWNQRRKSSSRPQESIQRKFAAGVGAKKSEPMKTV